MQDDGHTRHVGLKDVRHALQRLTGPEFFFEEACRVADEELGKPDRRWAPSKIAF